MGSVPVQKYIGPDSQETQSLIEKEKQLWASTDSARITRARLVNMVLAGGIAGPSPQEGKILRMLERAGLFLAGGILIGTPAFRTMGAMLGVAWEGQFTTRDVDIAADYRLPIAVEQKNIDLKSVLEDSGMGFIEIPTLNPKYPETSYKLRGGEYCVELLTPERGKPSNKPIKIPYLNAVAEPLRYLDYLIAAKSAKDIDQAKQLLEVLLDIRPGAVVAAVEAAEDVGTKFHQQYKKAVTLLPTSLQASLTKWTR